ncbi:MAG TPA: hypothetical protein VL244_10990 [Alphaproteobacteria bacterium]|nr:hypothetical protein [Alphaproteobacteria bacterium]
MRKFAIGAAAAGLVTLAAAFPLSAATTISPFAGAWHWNKDQSQLVPGVPVPTEIIWEIKNYASKGSGDYTKLQSSLTITYPDGTQRVEGYNGAFDGKPYPVRGRDDGATRSYKVLPDGSLQSEFMSPKSKVPGSATCVLSDENKKMTCKGSAPDTQGNAANFVAVFDRLATTAQSISKKKP